MKKIIFIPTDSFFEDRYLKILVEEMESDQFKTISIIIPQIKSEEGMIHQIKNALPRSEELFTCLMRDYLGRSTQGSNKKTLEVFLSEECTTRDDGVIIVASSFVIDDMVKILIEKFELDEDQCDALPEKLYCGDLVVITEESLRYFCVHKM